MRHILIFLLMPLMMKASAQREFSGSWEYAHSAVRTYLIQTHGDDYAGYSWGLLVTHLPPEFRELRSLLETRSQLDNLRKDQQRKADSARVILDSLIDLLEDSIMNQRIRPSYEILHFYHVREGKEFNVYGHTFYLNHAYKVMRMKTYLETTLQKNEAEWFYYWQSRFPLFNMTHNEENIAASNSVYDHLERGMEEAVNRSEFVRAGIQVVKSIRQEGVFDIHKIGMAIAENWLERIPDADNFFLEDVSDVLELSNKNEMSNTVRYIMYMRYTLQDEDTPQLAAMGMSK